MFPLIKATCVGLWPAASPSLATEPAFAQDAKVGNGTTIHLDGKVNQQVAAALVPRSTTHNMVGGIARAAPSYRAAVIQEKRLCIAARNRPRSWAL